MDITPAQGTTIEFKLVVSDANGVKIDTSQTEDGTWSVTVPQGTEGSYNVRLEVIANGDPVPVPEEPVSESSITTGAGSADAPGTQIGTDKLKPEFPVDNDDEGDEKMKGDYHRPVGDNSFDHIDKDELENVGSGEPEDKVGTPIEDIASRVNGASGPQLPFDGPAEETQSDDDSEQSEEGDEIEALLRASPDIPLDDDDDPHRFDDLDAILDGVPNEEDVAKPFDVKETAAAIVSSVLPKINFKVEAGKRLLGEQDRKLIARDPVTVAALETKSRKVRDILGIK